MPGIVKYEVSRQTRIKQCYIVFKKFYKEENLYDSKIAESVQAINNATSESEIDSIVASAKLALDDIHNNYQAPQSSSCFGVRVTYIMMATLVAAALLLVFKKREN